MGALQTLELVEGWKFRRWQLSEVLLYSIFHMRGLLPVPSVEHTKLSCTSVVGRTECDERISGMIPKKKNDRMIVENLLKQYTPTLRYLKL